MLSDRIYIPEKIPLNTSTFNQSIYLSIIQYNAFVNFKTEVRTLGALLRISSVNFYTMMSGTQGQ